MDTLHFPNHPPWLRIFAFLVPQYPFHTGRTERSQKTVWQDPCPPESAMSIMGYPSFAPKAWGLSKLGRKKRVRDRQGERKRAKPDHETRRRPCVRHTRVVRLILKRDEPGAPTPGRECENRKVMTDWRPNDEAVRIRYGIFRRPAAHVVSSSAVVCPTAVVRPGKGGWGWAVARVGASVILLNPSSFCLLFSWGWLLSFFPIESTSAKWCCLALFLPSSPPQTHTRQCVSVRRSTS